MQFNEFYAQKPKWTKCRVPLPVTEKKTAELLTQGTSQTEKCWIKDAAE